MTETKPDNGLIRLGTDLGPLAVFLIAYWRSNIFTATVAFMVAIVIAVGVSRWKFGRVAPLLWFSAIMVLVLGGLTVWLHDEMFIKVKPTIYYGTVAAILGFGWVSGKPVLRSALGNVYPELDAQGWTLLGRNFAFFFAGMAVLNEIVWRSSSTGFWLGFKLWGAFPLTLAFGLANLPMILKHSRSSEEEVPLPPSG